MAFSLSRSGNGEKPIPLADATGQEIQREWNERQQKTALRMQVLGLVTTIAKDKPAWTPGDVRSLADALYMFMLADGYEPARKQQHDGIANTASAGAAKAKDGKPLPLP